MRLDVERGLVSAAGARRYGVVLTDDGSVDEAATRALRAELAAQRGEPAMFDFGGTIEEIKARALEETHLPPTAGPRLIE